MAVGTKTILKGFPNGNQSHRINSIIWGRRAPLHCTLPFLGFSYPNLLLVFLNLLLLGTCIICFSQVLDFLWVFFILFYFPVPYFGLACDHGNSFLCLEE